MVSQKRRQVINSILGVGVATFPVIPAQAKACSSNTRFKINSTDGARMMSIYAKAVRRMNDPTLFPEGSPLSWMFQWYTHMTRGDRTKNAELNRVYSSSSPERALAQQMWDTCHSHRRDQHPAFFLPWHRMYLLHFEAIVRTVAQEPCFTLPYWDYTDPSQQALPEYFRQAGSSEWGPLFSSARFQLINEGTSLPNGPRQAEINLDFMSETTYGRGNGSAGFSSNLDGRLHSQIHVGIGTELGMGAIPYAAHDPIFWVHHCNIDRIWASWNFAGGKNPTDSGFLEKVFTFASPEGKRSIQKVRDILDIPQNSYDSYVQRPPSSPAFGGIPKSRVFSLTSREVSGAAAVKLSNKLTTVKLSSDVPNQPGLINKTFGQEVRDLLTTAPVNLLLGERSTSRLHSGIYDVYVHGANDKVLKKDGPKFVGQVNFFGTEDHHSAHLSSDRAISFRLRAETRKYLEQLVGPPSVSFVPTSGLPSDTEATISEITLTA